MTVDRRVARGSLSELGELVEQAKRRALAVSELEPVKEVVDGEHWIFRLRRASRPAAKQRRQ